MFQKPLLAARTLFAGALLFGSVATAPAVLADSHEDDDDDRFGTYIYAGTVDDIENATVVEDIDELEQEDDDDAEMYWDVIGDGQDMPDELYIGHEDLEDDVDLATLTDEPHMVVVHETDEDDSPIVAVGTIQGDASEDGSLLIQLEEYEDSGWEGRAWFGPELEEDDDDDNGDDDSDELETVIGVYPTGAVEPLGSPEATG